MNLINYASLVATNAARHRNVAGKSKTLLEFGLRRAQVNSLLKYFVMSKFWNCPSVFIEKGKKSYF